MLKPNNITCRRALRVSLVLTFLVIAAGSWVRATGSGMGCPDWPKCFGYYIPPTQESELRWKPKHSFSEKQMIVEDGILLYASKNFQSDHSFDRKNWTPYEKTYLNHKDFNPTQTWIEYINRLVSVILGFSVVISTVLCFLSRDLRLRILSLATLFLLGFQAWLGALVVYSELQPVKITAHLTIALVILSLMLLMIYRTYKDTPHSKLKLKHPMSHKVSLGALLLLLLQMIFGTQVRQAVDTLTRSGMASEKNLWLETPGVSFYFHRSLSIVFLLACIYVYRTLRSSPLKIYALWVLLSAVGTALVGIIMAHFNFPYLSQTLHLLLFSVLFTLLLWVVLCQRPFSPKSNSGT